MPDAENKQQLNMNFELPSDNRFRYCLEHGIFTLLFEHAAPDAELPDTEAAARLARLEQTALSIQELPCALALTDRLAFDASRRALDYASLLAPAHRNCHLVYLSGRNTPLQTVDELLAVARSINVSNLTLVSGSWRPPESVQTLRQMAFTESTVMLERIAKHPENELFFPGATVNPNLYSAPGLYANFFKLIKKIHVGAQFAVTQIGFDMAQLDAARKYLTMRGFDHPLIARLILLTPERLEKIISGSMPGITISEDVLNILNKELRFSASQFEAAQYRRLELQAAGCRLLGCSGLQIAGVDQPEKIRIVADRLLHAFQEFKTLDQWAEEYKYYLARSDQAPDAEHFYLFEKLLTRASGESGNELRLNDYTLPSRSFFSKLRDRAARYFFPDAEIQPAEERRWLKKLLTGCRGCQRCRLPRTQFLCPERCPKHLSDGVCGGVRANGCCEAGNFPCVHLEIWQAAERRKECDQLENELLPPGH